MPFRREIAFRAVAVHYAESYAAMRSALSELDGAEGRKLRRLAERIAEGWLAAYPGG